MADEQAGFVETLDAPANSAAAVTPSATALAFTTRALYVGGAGSVAVTMAGGGNVTFVGVPAGAVLPIRVTHVLAAGSGTTATNIVALW